MSHETKGPIFDTKTEKGTPLSPRETMMDLMFGSVKSSVISCAANLNIVDHLCERPLASNELAVITNCNPSALRRLLRALVSLGVLDENSDGKYSPTEVGLLLKSGTECGLKAHVMSLMGPEYYAISDLIHSVRTGEAAFDHFHGMSYFDYMKKNPEVADRYYNRLKDRNPRSIALSYDFTQFNYIVDVGGGNGYLLIDILENTPNARGSIFDRLLVCERATKNIENSTAKDRCNFIAGSFFESVPPDGDCYIIKDVIHDWNDEKVMEILTVIRKYMKKGSKLLVIEALAHGDHSPVVKSMLDMAKFVLFSGKERSKSEYEELFTKASLKLNQTFDVPSCPYKIMELIL